MYKILVFSDTHGRYDSCIRTIEKNPDTNLVIHAGDCVRDAEELSYIFGDIPFEFVRGNNDYFSHERDEKLLHVRGKKIFLTHGHAYNVKYSLHALAKKADELGADIAIFGHTHTAYADKIGTLGLLNPGASGSSNPFYGVIYIDGEDLSFKVLAQD